MLKRDFERVSTDYGTARRPAYQIVCSKCDKKDEVVSGRSSQIHPDILRSRFAQRGWSVSQASSSKDICPDCLLRGKLSLNHVRLDKAQPPAAEDEMGRLRIVENHPQKEAIEKDLRAGMQMIKVSRKYGLGEKAVTAHVHKWMKTTPTTVVQETTPMATEKLTASHILPEPVREPTRDDKKLINMKLTEVYLDNYTNGWTDKKVSEDLGVPQAWVATIREEFFGPENANDEATEYVKAVKELDAKITEFNVEMTEHHKALTAMVETNNRVHARFLKLREEFELLSKLTKHIEKQFR